MIDLRLVAAISVCIFAVAALCAIVRRSTGWLDE